jgi:hypothetical protein
MITIFKLLLSFVVASAISVFSAALVLFVLKYIVDMFKLNYGKDAYWVFNVAFYVAITVWIVSFFFSAILMEK